MSVIFLAGVHGVGKGFLGTQVAKSLGIEHFTASQLIREEKGRVTWGTDKRVAELDDNQSALVHAVLQRLEAGQDMLLDGHFVLRGASGELVRLAEKVFADLRLSGVVLLAENPVTIAERLMGRDGVVVKPEAIAELAEEESTHAQAVCIALRIPLSLLSFPTVYTLTEAIRPLLKKYS